MACSLARRSQSLERETGIEPATSGLGSRRSTAELLPLQADHSTGLSGPGLPSSIIAFHASYPPVRLAMS
jgi:hypothetical protein